MKNETKKQKTEGSMIMLVYLALSNIVVIAILAASIISNIP